MLLRHFNLREQPFGVTPDPRFLFATPTHREALAGLLYGVESDLGFMVLTAPPGMGKTTILFEALGRLQKTARTVFLFQTISSPSELMRALLIDLGEDIPQGSLIDLEMRLNSFLAAQSKSGQRLVVVLDEAQNLNPSVLEAVRMLSNFETASRKVLQIILCGQIQLATRLAEPALLQLRQRVSIVATLQPLTRIETDAYIEHRLAVAGYKDGKPLFTPEAVELIAKESGGIPRNINNLCFNALSLACALGTTHIDSDVIREVVHDLAIADERDTISAVTCQVDPPELGRQSQLWSVFEQPKLRALSVVAIVFILAAVAISLSLSWTGVRLFHWATWTSAEAHAGTLGNATALEAVPSSSSRFQLRSFPTTHTDSSAEPVPSATTQHPAVAAPPVIAMKTLPQGNRRARGARLHPMQEIATGRAAQTVTVRRGDSIVRICVERFDGCTTDLVERILELNPGIENPDRLRAGQRILVPVIDPRPHVGR